MSDSRLTRRALLKLTGLTVATTAASEVTQIGCASLAQVGRSPTSHPCDHRYCRYFRQTDEGGRCSLKVRVKGGQP